MAVKLTVLSGSMQGRTLETNNKVIRVGADQGSELPFDALSDPEIEGQQVRIELLDDRWRLFNASTQPLFVNQDLVRDATGLRSGDLIRLSQDGPDVLFELNQNSTASAAQVGSTSAGDHFTQDSKQPIAESSKTVDRPHEQTLTPASAEAGGKASVATDHESSIHNSTAPETPMASEALTAVSSSDAAVKKTALPVARRKSAKRRGNKMATLITLVAVPTGGIAGISIAVVLLWVIWKKDPLGIMQPPPATQQNDVAPGIAPDGRASQGSQLTPSDEAKLPSPSVTSDSTPSLKTERSENTTRLPTTPPPNELSLEPFEVKTVDLSVTPTLLVDLSRNVIKKSDSVIHYTRDPKTQQGVVIDPQTGLLTWAVPSALAGQEIEIPFIVSSGNPTATSKRGTLKLRITSTSPEPVSNDGVMKSIYMIATKISPGEQYLPLGTACSIEKNTLLTSATVAMGIFDAQKRGWKIVAVQPTRGSAVPLVITDIADVKAHKMYLVANQREELEGRLLQQAYFDLAILKTPIEMESSLRISQASKTQIDVENFICIGYPVNGDAVPDLSKLSPQQENVKLISRIPPANANVIEAKPPLLLQFEGAVPASIHGGIFLNSNTEVVGIYTFSAPRTAEDSGPNVCYASESLPAQLLLDAPDSIKFWESASEYADTQ